MKLLIIGGTGFIGKNLKKQIIVYPQDLTHIPVDLTNT